MTLQVEVELRGMSDIAIHDCAGRAVAATITLVELREEADMVPLSDDDHGNLRFNIKLCASPWQVDLAREKQVVGLTPTLQLWQFFAYHKTLAI